MNNIYSLPCIKANEHLKLALMFLSDIDANIIKKIIDKNNVIIDRVEKQSMTVACPNRDELGAVQSTYKRTIKKYYEKHIENKTNDFIMSFGTEYKNENDLYNYEISDENKEYANDLVTKSHIFKYNFYDKINNLIDITPLPNDISYSLIYLYRRVDCDKRDKLENEFFTCIKSEMIDFFISKHPNLTNTL
jgi:hypothetical protein